MMLFGRDMPLRILGFFRLAETVLLQYFKTCTHTVDKEEVEHDLILHCYLWFFFGSADVFS